ncbi:hypothetical protein [Methanonatronarchaeum sp. AMET-Sl]|uniref:hypothetical protein n=1 Tax=Methanonatronarchaeum sp. AMET-Sl TaxID=3037654 RepID=UPI00244E3551|nr:hypothetical protein [Methanonatronarchaeum sp. AMET-Sl]WGI17700.1 hypothetical protein QEN48_01445 [Methanonatronarchaeum sp. AMET-Sl]
MKFEQKAVLAGVVVGLGVLGGAIASVSYYLGNYLSGLVPWANVPGFLVQVLGSPMFHLMAIGFIASLSVLTLLYLHAIYTE